jgi:hypothetical protein
MRFVLRRRMTRLQPAMRATPTMTPITIPDISPILAAAAGQLRFA